MLSDTPIIGFIPTLDFDKARAFYVDTLGLRFVDNDGFAMVLDANGTMIRGAKVQPDSKPAMFTILGWKVSDIDNVVSAMTPNGVAVERFGFFAPDPIGIRSAPVR